MVSSHLHDAPVPAVTKPCAWCVDMLHRVPGASCLRLVNFHDVGSDEGAFAWLTLNYLLGFLGKEGADTMAAIDLGGGSVQEAFALTDAQAKAAPDPLYVTKLKGGGRTYSVYVHRFVQLHPCYTILITPQ